MDDIDNDNIDVEQLPLLNLSSNNSACASFLMFPVPADGPRRAKVCCLFPQKNKGEDFSTERLQVETVLSPLLQSLQTERQKKSLFKIHFLKKKKRKKKENPPLHYILLCKLAGFFKPASEWARMAAAR